MCAIYRIDANIFLHDNWQLIHIQILYVDFLKVGLLIVIYMLCSAHTKDPGISNLQHYAFLSSDIIFHVFNIILINKYIPTLIQSLLWAFRIIYTMFYNVANFYKYVSRFISETMTAMELCASQ